MIIIQELIIIYGRLQDLILLFQIPFDTWRNIFGEIYRQFWHAPSNFSANCGIFKSLLHFKAELANMRPSVT